MGRWIAAIVRDGAESALAHELSSEHSLEAYCPMHRRWRKLPKHIARKTGKSRELVQDALLLGYIFVRVDGESDLATLHGVKDVFGHVCTSSGPCFAREQDIHDLMAAEASGVHDVKLRAKHVRPRKSLEAMQQVLQAIDLTDVLGRTIRLTKGPFSGLSGEVTEVLGQAVRVQTERLPLTVSAGSFELA